MPVKKSERIQEIPLSELHPFKNHPFRVVDDEAMQRTVESVAQFGVLAPALARPRPEGGYELVAGHRRMRASELAGLEEKKSELDTVTLKNDVLRKYFPRSYTPKQMQDTIIRLLEQWQKKRQRDQSR